MALAAWLSLPDTLRFQYDAENRLTRVDFTGGQCEEYRYHAGGVRTEIWRNGQLWLRVLA